MTKKELNRITKWFVDKLKENNIKDDAAIEAVKRNLAEQKKK